MADEIKKLNFKETVDNVVAGKKFFLRALKSTEDWKPLEIERENFCLDFARYDYALDLKKFSKN